MWTVRLALSRPFTFIVVAVLLFLLGPLAIMHTPTADGEAPQGRFAAMQRLLQAFERRFSALRERYRHALDSAIANRRRLIPTFLVVASSIGELP
jgi:hypothetical protein